MSDKYEGLVTINDHTRIINEAPVGAKLDQLDSVKVLETLAAVSSQTETPLPKLLESFVALRETEAKIVHGVHAQIHSNKLALQGHELQAENARREHQLEILDRKIKAVDMIATKIITGLAAIETQKQQAYRSNATPKAKAV